MIIQGFDIYAFVQQGTKALIAKQRSICVVLVHVKIPVHVFLIYLALIIVFVYHSTREQIARLKFM